MRLRTWFFITVVFAAAGFAIAMRAWQASRPAAAKISDTAVAVPPTAKIVPARAEGPSGGFFIGTGDGGNGQYTR